jgi:hypothetical protein
VAFPDWARATDDPAVPGMQRAGQLTRDYAEIVVDGVPPDQFLFYRGVR